jgi:cytochrome c oxidase subunit 2
MSQSDYAKWNANAGESSTPMTMEQAGARIFNKIGCENCHGAVDTPRAPSLYAIYGKTRTFSNAAPQKADDEYILESILRPYNKLTTGYGETMPSYDGQFTEEDVLNLIAYIKTLGGSVPPVPAGVASVANGVTALSGKDVKTSLAVGSLRARTEDPDVTPTIRQNTPAVGSIAARGRTE